jgi:uncharacterized protein
MMTLALPVAEMSVNFWLVLALGGGVGLVSGIFGINGSVLLAPLLMVAGIPPGVAVATSATQVLAASVPDGLAHWRRGTMDLRMSLLLLLGAILGAAAGVWLFASLKARDQLDVILGLSAIILLGVTFVLMLVEMALALIFKKKEPAPEAKRTSLVRAWPLRMRFPRSRLRVSVIPPILIGMIAGALMVMTGTSGAFIMVPLLVFVLGMPSAVVVGTALFPVIVVAANLILMQAVVTQTVDGVLALVLLAGGMAGMPLGARIGSRLTDDTLRTVLAVVVLALCCRLGWDLSSRPVDLFSFAGQ